MIHGLCAKVESNASGSSDGSIRCGPSHFVQFTRSCEQANVSNALGFQTVAEVEHDPEVVHAHDLRVAGDAGDADTGESSMTGSPPKRVQWTMSSDTAMPMRSIPCLPSCFPL